MWYLAQQEKKPKLVKTNTTLVSQTNQRQDGQNVCSQFKQFRGAGIPDSQYLEGLVGG